MSRNLEDRVAWSIAAGLVMVGSVLLASYPAARYFVAREHADIARAAGEVFSTPLASLSTTTDQTFEVRVPDDRQWRRIENRLQVPTLVLMAVARSKRTSSYPRSVPGLHAHVRLNGTELALTPVHALLHSGEGDGLEMTAKRGDRLTISLRRDADAVAADAVVILAPNWSAPWLGSWGEGAAAGDLILPLGAMVLTTIGVGLWAWALTFVWGRPALRC